jgi:hypothetical protein
VIVRTTCPGCKGREVDLGVEAILLILDPDELTGRYIFVCPSCDQLQDKFAEPRIASLLITAGVKDEGR